MSQNLPHDPLLTGEPLRPSRPPAPSRVIIFVCWMLILAIVGLEVWANIERSKGVADSQPDNPALSSVAHCIVGARALTASANHGAQADPTAPLVSQLESAARSPDDRIKFVIIAEEVESAAQANAKLDELIDSPHLPTKVRADLDILKMVYKDGPSAISQNQRQRLLEDQGWFGQVALNFGVSDQSASRIKMLADAKRALLAFTFGIAGGIGGLVIGFALIVLAIVLSATGRLTLLFRQALPDTVFLEVFAVYLTGFVLLSLLLHFLVKSPGLGWTLVLTLILPIAVSWPVLRGKTWEQTRMELGWHTGQGIFREIGCGIIGYIAALPLLAVMLLITLQLMRLSGAAPTHPVEGFLNGSTAEIVLVYFIACAWAPVFEESMFRGALFNHLRARHGWWISAGVVGLLFAAVHPQGWTTIPVLGGIGMVLCALREWRGSLIASMAAHALNNGTVITLFVLTSR